MVRTLLYVDVVISAIPVTFRCLPQQQDCWPGQVWSLENQSWPSDSRNPFQPENPNPNPNPAPILTPNPNPNPGTWPKTWVRALTLMQAIAAASTSSICTAAGNYGQYLRLHLKAGVLLLMVMIDNSGNPKWTSSSINYSLVHFPLYTE